MMLARLRPVVSANQTINCPSTTWFSHACRLLIVFIAASPSASACWSCSLSGPCSHHADGAGLVDGSDHGDLLPRALTRLTENRQRPDPVVEQLTPPRHAEPAARGGHLCTCAAPGRLPQRRCCAGWAPSRTTTAPTITPYVTSKIRRFGDWKLDLTPPPATLPVALDLTPVEPIRIRAGS